MVDDGHIAARNVPRTYHAFQKYPNNPVMVTDRPWEGRVIQLYGTVLPGFRMWYPCVNADLGKFKQVLYAESLDGIIVNPFPENPLITTAMMWRIFIGIQSQANMAVPQENMQSLMGF